MTRFSGLIFLALFLVFYFAPLNTALAVPHHVLSATTFYRSPQSAFPSGQASRADLEKQQRSQEFRPSYKVQWDKKEYWMYVDQLVKDVHCSEKVTLIENSQFFERAESNSKILGLAEKDAELSLLEVKDYWALILHKKTNKKGWLPVKRLKVKNDDTGVFINLIPTNVRKGASHEAPALVTISKGQRLPVLGYENGFLKTEVFGVAGFVDLSHLVSRADFAIWGHHITKKWIPVSHRENEFLVTSDKSRYPLHEFSAFTAHPQKAVVVDSNDNYPPIRSHVKIVEAQAEQWVSSVLPGHGLVWWKKQQWNDKSRNELNETITADQLLERPIFSIALESGKSVKGLVSAKGIYKTEDGVTWTKINQFGDKDFPVAVHPSGRWFVGNYKSSDRGLKFEPFIRWDKLAMMIEAFIGRNPRQIRLQKLEALGKGDMQVTIDTSPGKINLRYDLASLQWSIAK